VDAVDLAVAVGGDEAQLVDGQPGQRRPGRAREGDGTLRLERPASGATRLMVTDDGHGFAPSDRERRAESGHVGLRLLEGLVEQAGGRLAVRSEPGEGTTVELEVPAQ
jgi:signal transduction histidine kinase